METTSNLKRRRDSGDTNKDGEKKLCQKNINPNFSHKPSHNLNYNNNNPSAQNKSYHLSPHTQIIPHPNTWFLKLLYPQHCPPFHLPGCSPGPDPDPKPNSPIIIMVYTKDPSQPQTRTDKDSPESFFVPIPSNHQSSTISWEQSLNHYFH